MTDVLEMLGRWSWSLVLALSFAIGCSSQQAPDSASGGSSGAAGGTGGGAVTDGGAAADAGFVCDIATYYLQLDPGGAPCAIAVALPPSVSQASVRVQDQSMVTIPYENGSGNGWMFGDPQAPIILVGSYCAAAMAGTLTAVNVLVSCAGGVIP
jgi:hypothetical protein